MKLYSLDNVFIKEVGQKPANYTGIMVYANGSKHWYVNDKRHRIDGPACEYVNGLKFWYLNGECHRLDGPAYEDSDGSKYWFVNGKQHRLDGPAVEYANGTKTWWIDDKKVTELECKLLYDLMKLKGLLCYYYMI